VTNEQLQPEDRPLVDRLFPEVTLSSFSSGLVRDTRDDPLETTSGSLLGVDGEVALRAIGSAVGFVKTTLQGFVYRGLPGDLVFAAGVRLGLARGFSHTVTLPPLPNFVTTPDDVLRREDTGESISVPIQALPASERFFAGGDTTVRGFALDRLGDGATIDPNGFPTGGNAMVVLNSELRVPVAGPLQVVGFLDAGNIFDSVSHLRPSHIRGGAGFGVRYGSPVGPIRVDLGFKLDRREFAGQRESLTALHLSIGQAF
jgi:outer membrane protein insertion porin family